jgi:hypothetical protein
MRFASTLACAAGAAAAVAVADMNKAAARQYELIPLPESWVRHHDPRLREAPSNGDSSNWSGYAILSSNAAPANGVVTKVVGSWEVPDVVASRSKTTYSANWVGIDGDINGTVEQIGTDSDWSKGAPQYYAWFEMYPDRAYLVSGFPVNAGDDITASVEYTGGTSFRLTITNNSTVPSPTVFTTTQTSTKALRSSAEWVCEAPGTGHALPLADFGTTCFTCCSATLNGITGPIDNDGNWDYEKIRMVGKTFVKATPSDLTSDGSGGSNFSVTWYHE